MLTSVMYRVSMIPVLTSGFYSFILLVIGSAMVNAWHLMFPPVGTRPSAPPNRPEFTSFLLTLRDEFTQAANGPPFDTPNSDESSTSDHSSSEDDVVAIAPSNAVAAGAVSSGVREVVSGGVAQPAQPVVLVHSESLPGEQKRASFDSTNCGKRSRATTLAADPMRLLNSAHLPNMADRRARCAYCGIHKVESSTFVYCTGCPTPVPLCLNKQRNCFLAWHTDPLDSLKCASDL